MTEHTPGPWVASKGPAKGHPTWTVSAKSPRSGHDRVYPIATIDLNPEDAANARLIAAAPDLLAALEDVTNWATAANEAQHAGRAISDSLWSALYMATNQARAAIAKARQTGG